MEVLNTALAFMVQGNFETAIPLLRDALKTLNDNAALLEDSPLQAAVHRSRIFAADIPTFAGTGMLCPSSVAFGVKPSLEPPQAGKGYTTPHETAMEQDIHRDDTNLLMLVCLYNLGLCYQVKSTLIPNKSSKYIQKAKSMYKHAIHAWELAQGCMDWSTSCISLWVASTSCNLASLYAETWDFSIMQICIDWAERQQVLGMDEPETAWFWQCSVVCKTWRSLASPAA